MRGLSDSDQAEIDQLCETLIDEYGGDSKAGRYAERIMWVVQERAQRLEGKMSEPTIETVDAEFEIQWAKADRMYTDTPVNGALLLKRLSNFWFHRGYKLGYDPDQLQEFADDSAIWGEEKGDDK